jgi:hypothetical protein
MRELSAFLPKTASFQTSRLLMSERISPNNAINADSEKRRAFVVPLLTAGYGEHWAS